MKDYPNRLWVLGGYNKDNLHLVTTEYIYEDSSVKPGPILPEILIKPCVIQVDEYQTIIVGGKRTWLYSHKSQTWREGPELNGDGGRACGKMYSAFHEKEIIVAIGKYSTEIVDLQNLDEGKWQTGKYCVR